MPQSGIHYSWKKISLISCSALLPLLPTFKLCLRDCIFHMNVAGRLICVKSLPTPFPILQLDVQPCKLMHCSCLSNKSLFVCYLWRRIGSVCGVLVGLREIWIGGLSCGDWLWRTRLFTLIVRGKSQLTWGKSSSTSPWVNALVWLLTLVAFPWLHMPCLFDCYF